MCFCFILFLGKLINRAFWLGRSEACLGLNVSRHPMKRWELLCSLDTGTCLDGGMSSRRLKSRSFEAPSIFLFTASLQVGMSVLTLQMKRKRPAEAESPAHRRSCCLQENKGWDSNPGLTIWLQNLSIFYGMGNPLRNSTWGSSHRSSVINKTN